MQNRSFSIYCLFYEMPLTLHTNLMTNLKYFEYNISTWQVKITDNEQKYRMPKATFLLLQVELQHSIYYRREKSPEGHRRRESFQREDGMK